MPDFPLSEATPEEPQALFDAAEEASRRGDDAAAHQHLTTALELGRERGDVSFEAQALLALGHLAFWYLPEDGGPPAGVRRRQYAERAREIYRELGDRPGEARALRQLASVLPPTQAVPMHEEALALCEAAGDRPGIAESLARLANVLTLTGPKQRAREMKEQALALYRELDDPRGVALVLETLAIGEQDLLKCRVLLEKPATLYEQAGDLKNAGRAYREAAMLGCADDELDLQESYLLRARPLCAAAGVAIWEAGCLKNLAEIERKRGRLEQAEALEAEARAIYDEPELHPEVQAAMDAMFAQMADAESDEESAEAADAMHGFTQALFFGGCPPAETDDAAAPGSASE
ncbi:MAG: tetratricopeptide repeat protein [Armatimonadota bacterium]